MPNLSKEQYKKWDSKAYNDFHFDIKNYLIWGEKTLIRQIELVNNLVAEFKINYRHEYHNRKTANGYLIPYKTGNQIPNLDINILYPTSTEGMYSVRCFEKDIDLGSIQPKCKYNILCEASKCVDVDYYLNKIYDFIGC